MGSEIGFMQWVPCITFVQPVVAGEVVANFARVVQNLHPE